MEAKLLHVGYKELLLFWHQDVHKEVRKERIKDRGRERDASSTEVFPLQKKRNLKHQ